MADKNWRAGGKILIPAQALACVLAAVAPVGAACGGRDGAIHFRGRLEEDPGQAAMPRAEMVLSIILDSPPNP